MKIVILDGYTANPGDLSWKALEEMGALTVYERTKPEETIDRAKDAEVVLTNKVLLKRQEIEQLPKLRYIGVLATGYNVVRNTMPVRIVKVSGRQVLISVIWICLLRSSQVRHSVLWALGISVSA